MDAEGLESHGDPDQYDNKDTDGRNEGKVGTDVGLIQTLSSVNNV